VSRGESGAGWSVPKDARSLPVRAAHGRQSETFACQHIVEDLVRHERMGFFVCGILVPTRTPGAQNVRNGSNSQSKMGRRRNRAIRCESNVRRVLSRCKCRTRIQVPAISVPQRYRHDCRRPGSRSLCWPRPAPTPRTELPHDGSDDCSANCSCHISPLSSCYTAEIVTQTRTTMATASIPHQPPQQPQISTAAT
jgi:hypothetical protein